MAKFRKKVDEFGDEPDKKQPITSLKILVIGESNVGKSRYVK
jgi:GTP-binding protein EngB required for normal cell division